MGSETVPTLDLASVQAVCSAVGAWVRDRGPAELPAIMDALQISVRAEKGLIDLQGTIPQYSPLDEHRHDYVDIVFVAYGAEDALA